MPLEELLAKLKPAGVFVDVKSVYPKPAISASGFSVWRL
jgi:UDP-N-acetyl-D-galactosamine dehydrogenase